MMVEDAERSLPTAGDFAVPSSLSEAVARHLGAAIVEGRLPPGNRLIEARLCAQFGISRTPLREALRILAAEGLVEISSRRGARVAELSERVIRDVFAVRLALEGLSARIAAERATPASTRQLRAINDAMAAAVGSGEATSFFALNTTFHAAIAKATDNEYLASLQSSAAARSFRPLFLSLSNGGHLADSVQGHYEILDAIQRRDSDAAQRAMEKHIKAGRDEALRLLTAVTPHAASVLDQATA